MTEIAWIVKLMTSYKLPDDAKEACITRIGEVEEKLNNRPVYTPPNYPNPLGYIPPPYIGPSSQTIGPVLTNPTGVPQSASTLAALARQAQGETAPHAPAPIMMAPRNPEAVVEINTGKGTKGPRKW